MSNFMSMRPGEIIRLKRSEWKELKYYAHLEYLEKKREELMGNTMLYWLGWKANFLDLEQAGWKVTMEHRNDYPADMNDYLLNLTHPNHKLIGRARSRISNTLLHCFKPGEVVSPTGLIFPMEIFFSNEIHIVSMEKGVPNYTDVRFNPENYLALEKQSYSSAPEEYMVITSDLFQPVKPNEIIVPQNNVDDLLEQLLKVQDPKQQEIRERMKKEAMREEYRTKTEEIARIIKVA